jgi:Flp pilus assembly protein TadG
MMKRMGNKAMGAAIQMEKAFGRGPFRRLFRRFFVDARGVTAIEFAVLAGPFLIMIVAILESCISFGAGQVLANATDDVARQLRTGQYKTAEVSKDKLRQMLCEKIEIMVGDDCSETDLYFDLRQYTTFALAAQEVAKIKSSRDASFSPTGFDSKLGAAGTINMLRVYYKWPILTDYLKYSINNTSDGEMLLMSVAVWQNEPFNN